MEKVGGGRTIHNLPIILGAALQETLVGGDTDFLPGLVPEQVAQDLVDDTVVKRALQLVGGPQAFGLALDLSRQEKILI